MPVAPSEAHAQINLKSILAVKFPHISWCMYKVKWIEKICMLPLLGMIRRHSYSAKMCWVLVSLTCAYLKEGLLSFLLVQRSIHLAVIDCLSSLGLCKLAYETHTQLQQCEALIKLVTPPSISFLCLYLSHIYTVPLAYNRMFLAVTLLSCLVICTFVLLLLVVMDIQ